MFERLFSKAVGRTGSIGTACFASFGASSANVGDTIFADFTWADAELPPLGGYAAMMIEDPYGNQYGHYSETENPTGGHTSSCTADIVGTWYARIMAWNGVKFIEATDTINVSSADGATRWEIAIIPDEFHEYWITQRMIDVVGSNKADDLFANIDPPDAQVVVFQYDGTGWKSWCTDIPGNTLDIVSTDFPIMVSANIPCIIIIGGVGFATIVAVGAPSTFTPGVEFHIKPKVRNDGESDTLFMGLYDTDTGECLKDPNKYTHYTSKGTKWEQDWLVTLTKTTEFHGRVDVGHKE